MINIPGKIPIGIHPLFWVTAGLIGFLNSGSFIGTLIWIFVILVSVLVHEFGHALTAKAFGLQPRVELVALGGLTYHQGDKLPFWKQFIIVFNGPLFGFILFLIAYFLLRIPALHAGMMGSVITLFYWVNLLWTILNLVPVMPLDGGQLLRIGLESFFGAKGFRYSLIIGILIAGGLSVFFFLFQQILIGALFFLFAFQSWGMFRRVRLISDEDRSVDLKSKLADAERALQEGRSDHALDEFIHIREQAQKGMIFLTATQYLAFLLYDKGQSKEAYDLLIPLRSELSTDALCLLHRTAFEQQDFLLVEEIGGTCFQVMPSKEVALRNAFACAAQGQPKPSVGWLETAFQEGLDNIAEILKGNEFDPIRDSDIFQQFSSRHPAD